MNNSEQSNEVEIAPIWPTACLVVGLICLILAAVFVGQVWYDMITTDLAQEDGQNSNDLVRMMGLSQIALSVTIFGALLTTAGLIFRKKDSISAKSQTIECPDCGRKNSVSTKICPRCGARFG